MNQPQTYQPEDPVLAKQIRAWSEELGFQQLGIATVELREHEAYLQKWLDAGYHGEMDYMQKHGTRRSRPEELIPDTIRVISVRMDYLPDGTQAEAVLNDSSKGYISRYAMGRDYHKLIRKRLAQLAAKIETQCEGGEFRAFVDSAPVLERALAENAGLGWIGKNTMLINKRAGSWFFLGEIYTNLPLPADPVHTDKHCGSCSACLDICPTNAFVSPFKLDARRCISYLTIEHHGSIPEELRPLMGNRIYGCDDCQLVCPWNKFAQFTGETDFEPRHRLDNSELVELFMWTEEEFLKNTEGSAIRRIGYERWLRNLAVALGNAPSDIRISEVLKARKGFPSELVQEHIDWAIHAQSH